MTPSAPAYGPSLAVASPTPMKIVGFVFAVLATVPFVCAFFLFLEKAFEWSAGLFLLSTILFWLAGRAFSRGRRRGDPAAPSMRHPGR